LGAGEKPDQSELDEASNRAEITADLAATVVNPQFANTPALSYETDTRSGNSGSTTTDHRLQPEHRIIAERWELIERIGKGGMSVVYKARHLTIGKLAAVKLLLPHLSDNELSLKRFRQEAKAASALNHRNIITTQDFGLTASGELFIIMDYLNGSSLGDIIARDGPLEAERACLLFHQTAEGLYHAHQKGIIHRDLKPNNLMIVDDGAGTEEVRIVDFGIAKILYDENSQGLTKTGEVFGSPLYMSPEQCEGQQSDARSDIYSMGCLMYEALSGRAPIVGENSLDTMHKQIREIAQPLVAPDGPDDLCKRLSQITEKCLEKNRKDRYQTAAELAADLAQAITYSPRRWRFYSSAARGAQARKAKSNPWFRLTAAAAPHWPAIAAATIIPVLALGAFMLFSPSFANYKSYRTKSLWELDTAPAATESKQYERLERTERQALGEADADNIIHHISGLKSVGNFYEENGHWLQAAECYENAAVLSLQEAKRRTRAQTMLATDAARCYIFGATTSDTAERYVEKASNLVFSSMVYLVEAMRTVYTIDPASHFIAGDNFRIPIDLLTRSEQEKQMNHTGKNDARQELLPLLKALEWIDEFRQNYSDAACRCAQIRAIAEADDDPTLSTKYLKKLTENFRLQAAITNKPGLIDNDAYAKSAAELQKLVQPNIASQSGAVRESMDILHVDDTDIERAQYGLGLCNMFLARAADSHAPGTSNSGQLSQPKPVYVKRAVAAFDQALQYAAKAKEQRLEPSIQLDYADALWMEGDLPAALIHRFIAACELFHQ